MVVDVGFWILIDVMVGFEMVVDVGVLVLIVDQVEGIDEIGTTLCLPTPGRSAMKSAAKMVVPVEEQQHGSPLPRGRRVSVKSPEAIRMEVEGGEEGETKEIVKTPGVALRSTRRGTRATPAPLPTPAPACSTRATARRTAARKTSEVMPTPATRRSQRTASRKAAAALEADPPAEDVPEEKTSKMTIALDLEAEVVKVQQDEPKGERISFPRSNCLLLLLSGCLC